jgi:GT2 family glycosyltransferase
MPVYVQDESYLRTALRTILGQTYSNFVLAVVVDGPLPDMAAIIEDATNDDPRVDIVRRENNGGTAAALNTGFDHLRGYESLKYLTWVSSDNVHYPQFLEKLRKALVDAPWGVGLSYSNFVYVGTDGKPLQQFDTAAARTFRNQPKIKQIDYSLIGATFMYKREYADAAGGYGREPVEDFDYWLRLTDLCDIVYVPEELMDYRHHPPLSKSQEIHTSVRLHREWRKRLNEARFDARVRRKIAPEMTVVLPFLAPNEPPVAALEYVLDQGFNNYRLLIVDISTDGQTLESLRDVEDPRIVYWPRSGTAEQTLREALFSVETPFSFVYREGSLPIVDALEAMRTVYLALEPGLRLTATYCSDEFGNVAYRAERIFTPSGFRTLAGELIERLRRRALRDVIKRLLANVRLRRKPVPELEFGELYRTETLCRVLNSSYDALVARYARTFRSPAGE